MACLLQKIADISRGLYFHAMLRTYGWLGLPAQTPQERQLFKTLFGLMAGNGRLRVFEWGCGLSTTYYASFLADRKFDFEWHALDNNRAWHERVTQIVTSRGLGGRVTLYLQEFPPFWEKPGWGAVPPPCGAFAPKTESEKAYVDLPLKLGGAFDVLIVDARFRRRCLAAAKEALKPDGIVVLHDAQKTHYQEGLDAYPFAAFIETGTWVLFQKVPNRVWIGSLTDHPVMGNLKTA